MKILSNSFTKDSFSFFFQVRLFEWNIKFF